MNTTPRRNECWLLDTPDPSLPRPQVLVLDISENRKTMRAAPFFQDGDDALPADRMLEKPLDFLGGERWLAPGMAEWVPVERFHKKVGALAQVAVTGLLSGRSRRGLPFLAGIGDAREERRASFQREFLRAASGTLVDRVLNFGGSLLRDVDRLGEGLAEVLFGAPVQGVAVARGDGPSGQAIQLSPAGEEFTLLLNPGGGGWMLVMMAERAVAQGTLTDGRGERFAMERVGDQTIFGNPLAPIAPGECSLIWRYADDEAWRAARFALPPVKERG